MKQLKLINYLTLHTHVLKLFRCRRRNVKARGVAKAKQACIRQDLKKFVRELSYIAGKGTLEEKKMMWEYLKDVVHSEFLKAKLGKDQYSRGMRWSAETKDFLLSQKLMGGKRVANGSRFNIGGPHIDTINKYLSINRENIVSGLNSLTNFESVAKRWGNIIKERKLTHPNEKHDRILVEMSEDESGMVPSFTYDPVRDSICGSCGWRDPTHKCNPSFAPVRK